MTSRALVMHVVGARPNYMKVAPVYAALAQVDWIEQRLVHTGQHYDEQLSEVFFDQLPLPAPHAQLRIGSGMHGEQTARALEGLERIFVEYRPNLVLVPGDVNSTLAGALAAAKLQIPVCHLEAGLRSYDTTMPEEHNRRLADALSTLLLTHSEDAADNLVAEGVPFDAIAFVGNTMIDTLFANLEAALEQQAWLEFGFEAKEYVLVTLHRPALVDDPDLLAETMRALEVVARTLPVVFPVHPRTRARLDTLGHLPEGVVVTEPLDYRRFLSLEAAAAGVVTDSGGVQEETTALGVPCFTLRDNTERPVTITHGTNLLLGLDPARLVEIPRRLLRAQRSSVPPLWDGRAGERAAAEIERLLERTAVEATLRAA
jgi:UDP-N-acetylglucosamine 2-epimerase (non-hydrolysing)